MKQSAAVAALALVVAAAVLLPVARVQAIETRPSKYTYQEDVNSDFVKGLGRFAVTVYKLAHELTSMSYASTSQCWSVPSNEGVEYWMVITVQDGTGAYGYGRYVCIVWGIPGSESKTWKLLSCNSTS
ncbi:hypothetical protein BRADI_3g26130v3 [Brachypodium distachyon]|uniref:Cystatin domain-containing protein n=1 Tax=Brachypodium distachyon TaxID=15368 RepID=I1I3W2_BRADI|nr:hypothetical protein BRADI_3g26130v3 [Brachypodium distachyon]